MAITRRNYTPGQYETFTNEPVGTPVLNTWYPFQLDGLFSFDVANDVILYQGGSPIPSTAYDLSEDATYTAREASFSGLTLVKQFRITNATYAGIATVASGKNFGSAVDNDLAYTLYINSIATQVIRTDYTGSDSLTTSTLYYSSIHVFGSLSADATFTITDGGGDERNKFTVKNDDGTYKIIVSGDVNYWVMPGQSVDFYYLSGALVWASAGWETIYKPTSPPSGNIPESSLLRAVVDNKIYKVIINGVSARYGLDLFTVPGVRCDTPDAADGERCAWYIGAVRSFVPSGGAIIEIQVYKNGQ